jgi:hypothetical protein
VLEVELHHVRDAVLDVLVSPVGGEMVVSTTGWMRMSELAGSA